MLRDRSQARATCRAALSGRPLRGATAKLDSLLLAGVSQSELLRVEHADDADALRFARRRCEFHWQGLRDGTSHSCTRLARSRGGGRGGQLNRDRVDLLFALPALFGLGKDQFLMAKWRNWAVESYQIRGRSKACLCRIAKERSSSCGRHGLLNRSRLAYFLFQSRCLRSMHPTAGFSALLTASALPRNKVVRTFKRTARLQSSKHEKRGKRGSLGAAKGSLKRPCVGKGEQSRNLKPARGSLGFSLRVCSRTGTRGIGTPLLLESLRVKLLAYHSDSLRLFGRPRVPEPSASVLVGARGMSSDQVELPFPNVLVALKGHESSDSIFRELPGAKLSMEPQESQRYSLRSKSLSREIQDSTAMRL